MEAFSLLKYWRGGGNAGIVPCANAKSCSGTTTIITAVDEENGDDGPFFDLEFAVPDEDEQDQNEDEVESDSTDDELEEREFDFTLSSGSSNDVVGLNAALSPSDDLFFKGRLMPIEPEESNSKHQFSGSLLKSATRFRVFNLGFKKSKQCTAEKAEEEIPIVSLFNRDCSSKIKSLQKSKDEEVAGEEKLFSKDVMQRYLKKVKPHYVKMSRRYGERLRFYGQMSSAPGAKAAPPSSAAVQQKELEIPASNTKSEKQGNIPAGLRVVYQHLGKSRSAMSAVAAAPPAASITSRRDDSLLQQQDGIQGAILHCKRSFQGSRD